MKNIFADRAVSAEQLKLRNRWKKPNSKTLTHRSRIEEEDPSGFSEVEAGRWGGRKVSKLLRPHRPRWRTTDRDWARATASRVRTRDFRTWEKARRRSELLSLCSEPSFSRQPNSRTIATQTWLKFPTSASRIPSRTWTRSRSWTPNRESSRAWETLPASTKGFDSKDLS